MAKKKSIITNAMRHLQSAGVEFEAIEYECDGEIGEDFGMQISQKTGIPPEKSFKTLVVRGAKKGIMVACIPVCCEVDLKKMAQAAGDKSVEMIHVKDIKDLTGYIRGGCTSIGMKKQFKTVFDASLLNHSEVIVSGGALGIQIFISPADLLKVTKGKTEDIIFE